LPVGSVVAGLIGQRGQQAAGAAYGQAGKNADFIRRLNEAKLSPWYQSGQDAQNVISGLLGLGHYVPDGQGYGGQKLDSSDWQGDQQNAFSKFQASPDYNFRLSEGTKALDRSAASRGMLLSGAQTKGVQQYGSDLASGEYANWFNRLAGVGSQGLSAAGTGVQSNLNALGQQNQALAGQASAYQNSANALASGISSGINNALSLGAYTGMIPYGGPSTGANPAAAGTPSSPYYGPVYSGFKGY
jgi:hypothetical protein